MTATGCNKIDYYLPKIKEKFKDQFICPDLILNNYELYEFTCTKCATKLQESIATILERGCKICDRKPRSGGPSVVSHEDYIESVRKVHNDTYDLTTIRYEGSHIKITPTCRIHGMFYIAAPEFKRGRGCAKCANRVTRTKEELIRELQALHGGRYDYSLIEFKKLSDVVTVICPEHGEYQTTVKTLVNGSICIKCSRIAHKVSISKTHKDYIDKFVSIHGNKYNYDKFTVTNSSDKGIVNCSDHGDFLVSGSSHLQGTGCPECGKIQGLLKTKKGDDYLFNEFVKRARIKHGNKYEYFREFYFGPYEKTKIYCPVHKYFWQHCAYHSAGNGCRQCSESRGERSIDTILTKYEIPFNREYSVKILGRCYRYDFILTSLDVFIEFHGGQHYKPIEIFEGEEGYKKTVKRDKIKENYAKKQKIPLLIFNYKHLRLPADVFENLVITELKKIVKLRPSENFIIRVPDPI